MRPAGERDAEAVDAIHVASWGGPHVVGHGVRFDLRRLPTLVAVDGEGGGAGAGSWFAPRPGILRP